MHGLYSFVPQTARLFNHTLPLTYCYHLTFSLFMNNTLNKDYIMTNGVHYLSSENKLFNDCIHGHFVLPPLCVAIIDTRVFQRLRNIKMIGLGYYVYPGACHNRFEHSLGVSYLAGEMVDTLNNNHLESEIKISSLEKLCLQVAGLCHDLGHGPFSHSWEKFIHATSNNNWKHEEMSVSLFDLVLDTERVAREFENSGLQEKHKRFIKDLILGKKDNESDRDFLFEIICNNETGIDVDKWDYLLRDGKQLNINITFDPLRLLKCLRIAKVDGKYHICYRKKERINIFHMYMMRAELHRMAYQHPVVKMIEEMWLDAMKEADSNGYSFKGLKLSETQTNPTIYSSLTDHIFQDILCSEDEKYSEARTLLERIQTRRLYKMVHRITLTTQDGKEHLLKLIKCTEMKKKENPTLDLHVASLELEMPDLRKSVYLYDKGNLNEAKSEKDWLSVPVFPYDMSQMKRIEIFHFCKKPESMINSEMKSLNEKVLSEIISECCDQTL